MPQLGRQWRKLTPPSNKHRTLIDHTLIRNYSPRQAEQPVKMGENTRASKRSYDMAFKQKVIACAEKGSNREADRNYRHDYTEINKCCPQINAALK